MLVSIVIPSHERLEPLKRLLDSILDSDFPMDKTEIIIVDDSKSFDVKKELKDYGSKHKNLKIIHVDKNINLSTARNIGIQNSNGEFVFLIDDDNVLDKKCISKLVNVLEKYENIGVACPIMYYLADPNKIWCAGVKFNPYISKTTFLFRNEYDKGQINDLIYSDFFLNAFMIKKEVIDKIGLFDDKNFPIHFDEGDFSERMKKSGYKIVFVPGAKIWHDIPTEVKEKARLSHCHNEKRAYYCSRNRIIFYRKHQPKKVLFVFFVFSLWLVSIHHIKLILFNLNKPRKEKIRIVKSYIKGIIDGLTMTIK